MVGLLTSHQPQASQSLDDRLYYFWFQPLQNKINWLYRMRLKMQKLKSFGHVGVFMPVGDEHTIVFDPTDSIVDCRMHPFSSYEIACEMDQLGYIVIIYKHNYKNSKIKTLSMLIPSCLSFVKALTGVPSSAVTPYGFAKYLLNNGGYIFRG